MTIRDLPALNACLNAASAVLLIAGYLFIRAGRVSWHRLMMFSALIVSTLFLISYLTYHCKVGAVYFHGHGPLRTVYLVILTSHTLLAIAIVPMSLRTLYLAWRKRFQEHRLAARWTWPVWMYVSVTGVIVYWMLYRL